MKIVDANVLIYAVNKRDPHHRVARSWLERALVGSEAIGFTWLVIIAFLRVVTSPAVFAQPLTAERALEHVEQWLAQPPSVTVGPTARHIGVLRGMLSQSGTAGNLVSDAHLAALSVEHGAAIASFDRDFLRFAGVRLTVPTVS